MNCTDLIMPTFSTLSAAMSFFLQRMILQPEIMQRIQNEIDVVVGSGRLPRLDDRVQYADMIFLKLSYFNLI